jgi:hypothetical protein
MRKLLFALRIILLYTIFGCALTVNANGFQLTGQVKQTPEVIEAYNVCRRFQQLLSENLDFSRAYDATFTKTPALQRKVAIIDGEFGNKNFKEIDTSTLVNAYKYRMQIFYLMLALADSKDRAQIFPPDFEKTVSREPPADVSQFPKYVLQLKQDSDIFRAHFDKLVSNNLTVAESIRKFKTDLLSEKLEPPTDYKVEPTRGHYKYQALGASQEFYEINNYILIKEQGKMKIVGIRFFTRLF